MCEKLAFFDFFESFVPPRNLRLLLHDAVIVGGTLNQAERLLEVEVECGETIPEAARTALQQLLTEQYQLRQLRLNIRSAKADKGGSGSARPAHGQGDSRQAHLHGGAEPEDGQRHP